MHGDGINPSWTFFEATSGDFNCVMGNTFSGDIFLSNILIVHYFSVIPVGLLVDLEGSFSKLTWKLRTRVYVVTSPRDVRMAGRISTTYLMA